MKAAEEILRSEIGLKTDGKGRKNYSIKAGAGGGKTTILSERISRQIIAGTPIEEFVVITYTEVAAAELRDKITDKLRKIVDDKNVSDEELNNAKRALETIELMQISTIHGFLLKILRENAFESNVVLNVSVLDENENEKRKIKFFDEWYEDHIIDIDAYSDDWKISAKTSSRVNDYTREVFYNMFMDMADIREEVVMDSDIDAYIEKCKNDYIKEWLPDMSAVRAAIAANQYNAKSKKNRALNKEANIVFEGMAHIEGLTSYSVEDACMLATAVVNAGKIYNEKKNIYNRCTEVFPDIDAAMGKIAFKLENYKLDWDYDFNKYYELCLNSKKAVKVAEYVNEMCDLYKKQIDKDAESVSNNDILYRTYKLLSEHKDILDNIRKQYSKIYVDEFQDTTGIQAKIVRLISEKPGTKYEDNDFQEDKLVVVGDPKQSIYRFTGAEKAIYDEVDKLMGDELDEDVAESVTFDSNFRSNKTIVDWVNNSFSKLIPDYTEMDTELEINEKKSLYGVYRYEAIDINENVEADEDKVVELVKNLVGNDKVFIEDRKKQEDGTEIRYLRQIKYSDIMIILKNTTNMINYLQRFSENGIPVNVQGKFNIDNDEVIKNFILLIKYFGAYKNKLNRMAAVQLMDGIDITGIDEEVLKDLENNLRTLNSVIRKNSDEVAAVVRYIMSREKLYLPKDKELSAERVREIRIRLNQMVESCLLNNEGDLLEFAGHMEDYISNPVKRENPLKYDEDAVRLMNVHQAKGLTGKIVIIADRTQNEFCRYNAFRKAGKYYPATVYKNKGRFGSSIIYPSFGFNKEIMNQVYREETEESVRLQYVAATRAAFALIFMPPKNDKVWFSDSDYKYYELPNINEWLKERLTDTKDFGVTKEASDADNNIVRLCDLDENLKNADTDTLKKLQILSITPSGMEAPGSTGYVSGTEGYVREARPEGNILGDVMHRVYQIIFERFEKVRSKTGKEREKLIERIINQAILEENDAGNEVASPDEFVSFLKDKMLDYFDKVLVPIFDEAEEVFTEYSFSFIVDDKDRDRFKKDFGSYFRIKEKQETEDEKTKNVDVYPLEDFEGTIWVNGKSDLIVRQKDGKVKVYDYKSDAHNGKPMDKFLKSMGEKYEGQLKLYSYAIGRSFGVSDVETELIHLYL